ncbi:hypothetical protein EDC96DRAFT_541652 [Choanephora cucurbitarum]|nr:hypothetical protein EDC96DRAFT_541652 [Choanephora cucurbitarum]
MSVSSTKLIDICTLAPVNYIPLIIELSFLSLSPLWRIFFCDRVDFEDTEYQPKDATDGTLQKPFYRLDNLSDISILSDKEEIETLAQAMEELDLGGIPLPDMSMKLPKPAKKTGITVYSFYKERNLMKERLSTTLRVRDYDSQLKDDTSAIVFLPDQFTSLILDKLQMSTESVKANGFQISFMFREDLGIGFGYNDKVGFQQKTTLYYLSIL